MACMIQMAPPMTMAATPLVRVMHYEDVTTWHFEGVEKSTTLRMNWVAVTDSNGNRKLQMQWKPSAEDRRRPFLPSAVTLL